MNNVSLIGRLVKDPEIRQTGQQQSVCTFTIAVDKQLTKEKKEEMEQQNKPTADFIRIVTWGKQAQTCKTYLHKGSRVGINGSISTSSSTDEQNNKTYYTDIIARNIEFLTPKSESNNQTQKTKNTQNQIEDDVFEEMELPF